MINNKSSGLKDIILNSNTFIIYCIVGVISAVVDIYSLHVFTNVMFFNSEISVTIAFTFGLIVNYFLHSYLTFKSEASRSSFKKYLVVVAVNYILTMVLIKLLVNFVGLDLISSKIVTLPLIAIIGFVFSKLWIYKR